VHDVRDGRLRAELCPSFGNIHGIELRDVERMGLFGSRCYCLRKSLVTLAIMDE